MASDLIERANDILQCENPGLLVSDANIDLMKAAWASYLAWKEQQDVYPRQRSRGADKSSKAVSARKVSVERRIQTNAN